ncbi:MAG TPA: hypothetical protein VG713_03880 [Pirellulales bacterium]|nr:hypothetical protein [Pirellulales bacterium]
MLATLAVACLSALIGAGALAADEPVDLTLLEGKTIDVVLKAGKSMEAVEVAKVTPGSAAGSIKAMTVKVPPTGRIQPLVMTSIEELKLDGQPLDVLFDLKQRTLAHSPERRAKRLEYEARVKEQLKAKRAHLWPEYSAPQQQTFVDEEKEFINKIAKVFPGMTLYETKYYLFYTDMPEVQIKGYIAYLDDMYAQLCKAYGVPEGKNVWRGKCVVVAFVERKSFTEFEQKLLNNADSGGAQGIAHSFGNGRVVISCYRGNDPAFFATVLVHETSHGFVHRYKSSARIPSWINEGIADWVAAAVVRADDNVQRRQREAARIAKESGSLGGNFFDDKNIEAWQYGAATTIVDMLLKMSGKQYRAMIDGIKDGLDWEESLKQAYNLTVPELVQRYGQYIGAPNLRP